MNYEKYVRYKQNYLQSKNINDKIMYKYYKKKCTSDSENILFGGVSELSDKKNFYNYCKPDKFEQCVKNIYNMRTLLEPLNIYRTTLQGMWIRDVVGIERFVNEVLVNKFGFNINFLEIEFTNLLDNNEIKRTMDDLFVNIKSNNIYFINVSLPNHINLIYMDTYNNESSTKSVYKGSVYIYEPHVSPDDEPIMEKYNVYTQLQKIYKNSGYNVLPLPKDILQQRDLPLCYMYVLHFYMFTFVTASESRNIITTYRGFDDIYIANFTHFILKLCHEYTLMNSIDYYILTNNTFQIQKIINDSSEINDLFSKISSKSMAKILYSMTENISLGSIANVICDSLLFEEYIAIQLYQNIINIIRIQNKTALQTIETRIVVSEILASALFPTKKDQILDEFILETDYVEKLPNIEEYYSKIINSQKNILTCSVEKNKYDLVVYLLSKNINIDVHGKNGWTALMYAVNNSNEDMVKLLLSENANVNSRNGNGGTALMLASYNGNENIVKLLLSKNVDINAQDYDGWTPLMIAVSRNNENIVKLLLPDADVNLQNNNGSTALTLANNENIIRILNAKNKNYMTRQNKNTMKRYRKK